MVVAWPNLARCGQPSDVWSGRWDSRPSAASITSPTAWIRAPISTEGDVARLPGRDPGQSADQATALDWTLLGDIWAGLAKGSAGEASGGLDEEHPPEGCQRRAIGIRPRQRARFPRRKAATIRFHLLTPGGGWATMITISRLLSLHHDRLMLSTTTGLGGIVCDGEWLERGRRPRFVSLLSTTRDDAFIRSAAKCRSISSRASANSEVQDRLTRGLARYRAARRESRQLIAYPAALPRADRSIIGMH